MGVDGMDLPAVAREAVRARLEGGPAPKCDMDVDRGVFVTIRDRQGLRGCIGYAQPVMPLGRALPAAAVAAAFEDPRFPPLQYGELEGVRFEVTILDEPEIIRADTPQDYIAAIRPGRDGLVVKRGGASGLLLPQVAAEMGWSALQLLQHTCMKAGLGMDEWKDADTDVYKFGGRVYSE